MEKIRAFRRVRELEAALRRLLEIVVLINNPPTGGSNSNSISTIVLSTNKLLVPDGGYVFTCCRCGQPYQNRDLSVKEKEVLCDVCFYTT